MRKVMEQRGVRVVGRGGSGGRSSGGRRRVASGKLEVAPGKLVVVVTVVAVAADAAVAVAVRDGGGVPVVDDGVHRHGGHVAVASIALLST